MKYEPVKYTERRVVPRRRTVVYLDYAFPNARVGSLCTCRKGQFWKTADGWEKVVKELTPDYRRYLKSDMHQALYGSFGKLCTIVVRMPRSMPKRIWHKAINAIVKDATGTPVKEQDWNFFGDVGAYSKAKNAKNYHLKADGTWQAVS